MHRRMDGVRTKRAPVAAGAVARAAAAALVSLVVLGALAGCGGMAQGFTVGGAASIQPGGSIGPAQKLRVAFLQQVQADSLPGNITVTAGGRPVPFLYALTDGGYTLEILPVAQWPAGQRITVTLAGGEGGIRWVDGRFARTMNLEYTVRPTP